MLSRTQTIILTFGLIFLPLTLSAQSSQNTFQSSKENTATTSASGIQVRTSLIPIQFKNAPRNQDDELTFYNRTGESVVHGLGTKKIADHYEKICIAPCTADIPKGKHRFALALGQRTPLEPEHALLLNTSGTVTGHYNSKTALRTAGWITFALGLALAGASPAIGYLTRTDKCLNSYTSSNGTGICGSSTSEYNYSVFGLALGAGVAAFITGVIMAAQGDSVEFEVTPSETPRN